MKITIEKEYLNDEYRKYVRTVVVDDPSIEAVYDALELCNDALRGMGYSIIEEELEG